MHATFERGPLAPSAPPERTFPLVRHLSYRLTPALVRLPVTANQITAASLVAGLGCAWCYMQGGRVWALGGSALFILCYVLDNCDGEIARLKGLQSDFGMRLDSFTDWLVHTAFFVALGIGIGKESGEDLWLWLGWLAAAGATINHILVLTLDARSDSEHDPERAASFEPATPDRVGKAVYNIPRTSPRRLLFRPLAFDPLRGDTVSAACRGNRDPTVLGHGPHQGRP